MPSPDHPIHDRTPHRISACVIATWSCIIFGLSAASGVAQSTDAPRLAPRAASTLVAPDPPELVPHPASPYQASAEYDPFPAQELPADLNAVSSPGRESAGPQFPLPEVRVDSAPPPELPSTESGLETTAKYLTGSAVDPTPMLQTINEELNTAARRESDQFDSLHQGLQKLRRATESMRQRAQEDQKLLEAERRRTRRAERLAEDSRQQAEQARVAAEETLRRFQELHAVPEDPAAEPAQSGEINNLGDPDDNPTTSPVEESPPDNSLSPAEPPLAQQSIVTSAIPVTDDTVDRESLANNLFGAEQYKLALPIYAELVKTAQQKEDELWYQYQLACCYRNLGSFPQAEKHYRIVAGRKDSYLAAMARWYLSLIQEQRTLREQMASWELVLGQIDDKRNARE